jgi:hypothetical protein
MNESVIHIRLTRPGFHHWPGAPEHRAYLAAKHRHLFAVEVTTAVHDDDREIEFHDVRDAASAFLDCIQGRDGDFGSRSCEQIARELAGHLAGYYKRPVIASVWEDWEFGATVEVASGDETSAQRF